MLRKAHTRGGNRQRFYHQRDSQDGTLQPNNIVRPPTSHPYSGYTHSKSQSQIRQKYMPNYSIQNKLQSHFKSLKNSFKICHHFEKMPQNMKLMISQVRILCKGKNSEQKQENDNLDKVISSICKNINEIYKQKQNLQKAVDNYEQKVKFYQEKLEYFQKNCKKNNTEVIKRNSTSKQESLQQKFQQLMIENCKIGQLNTKYKERINQLECQKQESFTPIQSKKQLSNRADTELLRCHNRISYLQIKLENAQKMENQLLLNKQLLGKQIKQLNICVLQLSTQNKSNKEQKNQWRERALMQRQDSEIHISRQQFLLYSLKKLRESNKNLIQKLLSLSSSEEKIQKKDFVKSPNFDYEMDFFRSIPKMYEKGKIQRFYPIGQTKKNQLGLEIQEISLESDYQSYKKADPFNISDLRIYRPSFFSFLQQSANQDIYNYRQKGGNSVSRIFIQVIRCILNSKLNEFMFSESVEKYSRFPQFVYSWFQKFYFNSDKNCVCALENFMQKPISQQNFYRDLMNVKLDQSWEIITFREFLLQELSLQELYFYLLCQMLLYSRAGISTQIQYLGDFCILVEYSAAKTVLDVALNDFQSWNISFLTSKLRERLIIKRGKEFIEAGFFLRCLIEYYRIERSNRYRYISKLCSQFQDNQKGLRFSSFMSVINKFTEVSMADKLRIYRNCYSLTKGVINPESIFIICSQQLIFLKFLKMKSFFRLPKIVYKPVKFSSSLTGKDFNKVIAAGKSDIATVQKSDGYILEVLKNFYSLVSQDQSLLKRVEQMGVYNFNHQINHALKALDQRNSQIGSSTLKCKHFIHYFSTTMETIRKVSFYNFYELLEEQNKKRTSNFWITVQQNELTSFFIEEMMDIIKTYRKINEIRVWKDKVYNFRIHHAAKKIQRQAKKKFIEPYLQIYNYFSNEIKEKNSLQEN